MMHPHPKPDEDKAGQARGKPISEFNPAELRDKIEALSREVVELASVKTRRIAELEADLKKAGDQNEALESSNLSFARDLASAERLTRDLRRLANDLEKDRDAERVRANKLDAGWATERNDYREKVEELAKLRGELEAAARENNAAWMANAAWKKQYDALASAVRPASPADGRDLVERNTELLKRNVAFEEQVRDLTARRKKDDERRFEDAEQMRELTTEAAKWRRIGRKALDEAEQLRTWVGRRKRWVHVKRGSHYAEIVRAKVQASTRPIEEGDTVVVYGEGSGGDAYARRVEEFEDGRFITLDTWMDQNAGNTPVVELPQSVMGALMDAGRVLADILDGSSPVKALDAEAAFNVVNAAIEATGAPNLFGSRPRRAGRATVRPIEADDEDDTAMVERIADGLRKMTELDEAGLSTGSGVPGDGDEGPERFASGGFVEMQPLPLVGETPSPALATPRRGGHIAMFAEAAAVIDTTGAILKARNGSGPPGELVLAAGEHVLIQEADGSRPLARVYVAGLHNRAANLQVYGIEADDVRDARKAKFEPDESAFKFNLVTSDDLGVRDQGAREIALLSVVDVLKDCAILKARPPSDEDPLIGRWRSIVLTPRFPVDEVTPPAVLEALDPGPAVEEAGAFSATDPETRMVPRYVSEPSELYGDGGPDGSL